MTANACFDATVIGGGPAGATAATLVRRIAELKEEIREREEKYPPCGDTIKPLPCYFNTGCCKFEDGDITGIELEDGAIRLIKWSSDEPERGSQVLEEGQLKDVFAAV